MVIGILIALQVNTWSENQKKTIKEQFILVKLKAYIITNLYKIFIGIKKSRLKKQIICFLRRDSKNILLLFYYSFINVLAAIPFAVSNFNTNIPSDKPETSICVEVPLNTCFPNML